MISPRFEGERLVFGKAAGRWFRLPASRLPAGPTRAFGPWLAVEEWRDAGTSRTPEERISALEVRDGPFPTGRLLFYDTRPDAAADAEHPFLEMSSGRLIEHHAGDPDSEILLIDDNDVAYFRVGDELRRADLRDGGLANEEVLAKARELLAVHWLVRGSY